MKKFLIDGIQLHSGDSIEEMKVVFKSLIEDKTPKYISFINPEIFLQTKKSNLLKLYFENSKYNFIDGIGLLYAINRSLGKAYTYRDRYSGTDFFSYLPSQKIRVFLYGSKPGNAELAKEKIELKYSNISIVDFFDGFSKISNDKLVERINASAADILIVCIGCPKQELWIKDNLCKLNVSLVFGNGGSIDFWSGEVKRAPKFMINHGLEFVYRLFQDFSLKRIRRQSKLFCFYFSYIFGKYKIEEL